MPRFRKGTLDHDGDGRKGGSMPAKKKTTTRATKEQNAALDAAAVSMATVPDPQSGGVSIQTEDTPSRAQVKKAQQEAVEAQFAAADEKGAPTADDLAETRIGLAVRGY